MVNSISSGMSSMPQMQSSQSSMSTEQKSKAEELLSQFSADDLSSSDATSIVEGLAELNISPSKELEQLMADSGFDAKSIGDMAGVEEGKRPPPPPPPNESGVSDSSDMVSFLEDLLEDYDEQLTDEDKETILSAVKDQFSTDEGDSLVNVTA